MRKILVWVISIVVVVFVVAFSVRPILEWYLFPSAEYSAFTPPKAPDYSDLYFWVAHADIQDSSDLIPPNISTEYDLSEQPVDVFFVHSTGYVGPGSWNSTMEASNSEAQSIEYMLTSMASTFNGCCRVFAPHYREAHLASFISDDTESSYQALDLAYEDVKTAFKYFLDHFNKGRPFIIVGHSQGTLHSLRLLHDFVDGKALQRKMVAAYTIGYWLPMDMFERSFSSLQLCSDSQQTGCIISYDTYGKGGYKSVQQRQWYPSGWEITSEQKIACVNPLSWKTDQNLVDKSTHLGAMPVEFKRTIKYMLLAKNPGFKFTELPPVETELLDAQCQESGVLHVTEQIDNPFSNHLNNDDKSYHLLDFSLFYGNIRENALVRTNAFINQPSSTNEN